MKGGPYWHVIRFLDHPLLPANAPRDFPKIIKHGISDDGPMHPKSPHVTAPDGVVTLLYRMGKEDWMKRFLDVEGTYKFKLVLRQEPFQDLYVDRKGRDVEIGFLSTSRTSIPEPGAGIRYHVQTSGEWTPISTSDMGSAWGGTPMWVRGQGEGFAKAVWYHQRWTGDAILELDWTGITEAEKESRLSCEGFGKKDERKSGTAGGLDELRTGVRQVSVRKERWSECRGGCGEKNCKLACSRCKETRYCSPACQREDWKYHKSVCGKDQYGMSKIADVS